MSPFKPLIPISKSLETLDNERFVPLGTFISFLKEYIAQKGEFCNVPGKVDVECNVRASQYRFICEYGDGEYIILFRDIELLQNNSASARMYRDTEESAGNHQRFYLEGSMTMVPSEGNVASRLSLLTKDVAELEELLRKLPAAEHVTFDDIHPNFIFA